jgi:hypothetical protein
VYHGGIIIVDGEQDTLCYPFTMQTKRHVSDLFLNTNNPIVSNIFGNSNNITMGNRNCIYTMLHCIIQKVTKMKSILHF